MSHAPPHPPAPRGSGMNAWFPVGGAAWGGNMGHHSWGFAGGSTSVGGERLWALTASPHFQFILFGVCVFFLIPLNQLSKWAEVKKLSFKVGKKNWNIGGDHYIKVGTSITWMQVCIYDMLESNLSRKSLFLAVDWLMSFMNSFISCMKTESRITLIKKSRWVGSLH